MQDFSGKEKDREAGAQGAAIAFVGGTILTMDRDGPRAEAVVIVDGRIAEVGTEAILAHYPGAKRIDLNGRALLPAFIDSHNHLSFGCFLPLWADLKDAITKDAILEVMEEQVKASDLEWVVGFPWNDAVQGGQVTKQELDAICPDRPMALIHGTFHKVMLNSAALRAAGMDGPAGANPSREIERGDDGEPNGVVHEVSEVAVLCMVTRCSTEEYADLIERRARSLVPYGITAVQDPGVTPEAEAAYRLLHDEGRLPLSVLMMPHGRAILDNNIFGRLDGPVTGTGDELLRVGPVKLFADGGTSGDVANAGTVMGRPYKGAPPRPDFVEPLAGAIGRGFQVCVHSIGNMATDAVLDAFEKAVKEAPEGMVVRPRIEHLFTMSDAQIARLAAIKGCASIQPFFFRRVGDNRKYCFDGYKWFPFGDLVRAGVVVSSSSDDPGFGAYAHVDPVQGSLIGAAMGDAASPHHYPEQAMPFEQWLWMYTAGAAYVGGVENERGMLKKGMMADLVVLSAADPKQGPAVVETWKAGKKVYDAEGGLIDSDDGGRAGGL